MNRLHLLLFPALFLSEPAFSAGMAQLKLGLFDSEWREALVMEPSGKVALRGSSGPWSGSIALNLTAKRNAVGAWDHVPVLDEARVERQGVDWVVAAGRLGLRPFPIPFHEGAIAFLRSPLKADGLSFDLRSESSLLRAFVGGPWVAGFGAAFVSDDLGFSFLYRGERSARVEVPVSRGVGAVALSPRAVHEHEWEIGATYKGEDLAVVSLFQGRHWGALRFVSDPDRRLGSAEVGGIDEALPKSSDDYRAMTQISVRVFRGEEHEVRSALAVGGYSAPRYHMGSALDVARRQGGGNDLFLSTSIEDVWKEMTAQAGIAIERATANRYLLLSRRTTNGSWKLVNYRVRAWTTASFAF